MAGSWWRTAALALVCVQIAVLVLVFDTSVRNTFDLPKAVYSHALAWLLVGALLVIGLRDGFRLPVSPLFLAFYALLAVQVLTTVTATNQYVALYGEVGRYLGLTTHAALAVMAVAIAVCSDYPRRISWLAWTASGTSLVAGGYAAIQALGLDPVGWADLDSRSRPFATLGNPDFYGQFLSVMVIGATGAAIFGRLGRLRWAVVALAALNAALMVIVATRGSAVGIAAGVGVLGLLWMRREGLTRRAFGRLALAAAAALLLSGVVATSTPIGARLLDTARGVGLRDRVLLYESAAQMFVEHPIAGVGFENFAVVYPRYQQAEWFRVAGWNTTNTSAHNWVLHLAATTGALGLVSTVLLLVLVAMHTWRRARDADSAPLLVAAAGTAAYYGSGLVLPGAQGIHWIPWALLGVALASELRTARTIALMRGVRVSVLIPMLIVLVLAGVAVLQLSSLTANRSAKVSEVALRAGAAGAAVAAARSATTTDPSRAVYWNDLGRALELANDRSGARAAYVEATSRSPYTPAFWWNLSRMHQHFAERGDEAAKAAAYQAMERAIAASPQNPESFDRLARIQLAVGDFAGALESERRAISYYPALASLYAVAADAAHRLGDVRATLEVLRQGIASTGSNELRVTLARRLADAGLFPEARAALAEVLRAAPTHAAALELQKEIEGR